MSLLVSVGYFLLQKNRQDKESATIVNVAPFDYNKRETRLVCVYCKKFSVDRKKF